MGIGNSKILAGPVIKADIVGHIEDWRYALLCLILSPAILFLLDWNAVKGNVKLTVYKGLR
ncbi:MAG: hypothetical protein ACYTFW_12820 [Planctomycetota bacterium]|jgi:hypothetical protein